MEILIGDHLGSSKEDMHILLMLYRFIEHWKKTKDHLQTVCIIFKDTERQSEADFELILWERLQKLHELDCELYSWDKKVSSQVSDRHFSFSIGGHAFFVVGLHPGSSRKSRQFKYPTLIFNLHVQFETLRDEGVFEICARKFRKRIWFFPAL